MKAAHRLVTLFGGVVLMQGVGFAEPPSQLFEPASSQTREEGATDRPHDEGDAYRETRGTQALDKKERTKGKHSDGKGERGRTAKKGDRTSTTSQARAEDRVKEPPAKSKVDGKRLDKNVQARAPMHLPGEGRLKTVQNKHELSGERRAEDNQSGSTPKSALNHSGFGKVAGAREGAFTASGIQNRSTQLARLPLRSGFGVPSPNAPRPRGSAPPILGGAVSSTAKDTAVITGTGIARRP